MPLAFKSDRGYYVTPFGRILENRAIEVTISDELYAFIDNQSEEPVTFETINKQFLNFLTKLKFPTKVVSHLTLTQYTVQESELGRLRLPSIQSKTNVVSSCFTFYALKQN